MSFGCVELLETALGFRCFGFGGDGVFGYSNKII